MVATRPEDVVVLIPTLNEAQHIETVLGALLDDDAFARRTRVIVADGGSTDATRDIVGALQRRYANVSLMHNPGQTQSHAMNLLLGPDFADARVIVRCDAHADYPRGFLSRLVATLDAHPDAASIVISMDAVAKDEFFQTGLALIADSKLGAGGSPHRGGAVSGFVDHGHHAAFRAEVFRTLGGYDTTFRANEDAEYDRRLTNAGHLIWLQSDIRIGYYPRSNVQRLWRQYHHYGMGRARTCFKHGVRPAVRQLIPLCHAVLLIMSLAILPFTSLGLVWPAFYLGVVATAAVSVAWANRCWCGLVAFPALICMHTAWGLGFLSAVPIGLRMRSTEQAATPA
ncbi:hypothetical protein ATO3_13980 [Marinibacterium profundimaris]|uniref:Glycosyltransferase 2-like domain-containing protein n=1 Tax=Marinibacterium profundimaris TaxID=1679460 RepID=A0A225NH56_9RHOB|nr:hypothetical protein ATO3_13980 [Marinibacterium profundimaris]